MNEADIVEDYTLQPVPAADAMSGVQIAVVLLAIGFTLPLMELAAQIAKSLGVVRAAGAYFAGCMLVASLSLATSVIGARRGVSTYVILISTFGRVGGKVINLIIAVTLLGWFANVSDILGTSVSHALKDVYALDVPRLACSTAAIVAMTLTAIFGFRMIERFATVMAPLLGAFMLLVLIYVLHGEDSHRALAWAGDGKIGFLQAVSAIVGSVSLTAVLAPDFTRYARSERAALVSVLPLAVGYPLIMLMAAIPAVVLNEPSVMKMMVVLGMPGLALVMLIGSTWTSNTGNLYSFTLTLSTVFPSVPGWRLGVSGALLALVAAIFEISSYFVQFLVLLGVTSLPVAAVYMAEQHLLLGRHRQGLGGNPPLFRGRNLAVCLMGAVVGYAADRIGGFDVTVPAIDGFLATVVFYLAANHRELAEAWRERRISKEQQ